MNVTLAMSSDLVAFFQVSVWDALVVAAAEAAKSDGILSEDLNNGQRYCGILASNPF